MEDFKDSVGYIASSRLACVIWKPTSYSHLLKELGRIPVQGQNKLALLSYLLSGVGLLPGGTVAVSVSTSRWRHNPKRALFDQFLFPEHGEGWTGRIRAVTLLLSLMHQDLGRSADGRGVLCHYVTGDSPFPSIFEKEHSFWVHAGRS